MENEKLFVLGDSVSIHYGPYLKEGIKDKFDYDRKRGMKQALEDLDKPVGANGGDSTMVLEYLIEEQKKNTKYNFLLINCGLHDLRVDRESRKVQVKLEEYKTNLVKIIEVAKTMANRIIWVSLTPVVDEIHNARKGGVLRYSEDVIAYDKAAKEIMKAHNIPCIDLYNFTKNLGQEVYFDHVHFKEEVRRLQGAFIGGYLNCLAGENLIGSKYE